LIDAIDRLPLIDSEKKNPDTTERGIGDRFEYALLPSASGVGTGLGRCEWLLLVTLHARQYLCSMHDYYGARNALEGQSQLLAAWRMHRANKHDVWHATVRHY
jgi:hypothetical protein